MTVQQMCDRMHVLEPYLGSKLDKFKEVCLKVNRGSDEVDVPTRQIVTMIVFTSQILNDIKRKTEPSQELIDKMIEDISEVIF